MQKGSDKRIHPRYSLNRPLIIFDSQSEERLGALVNVSEDGLMLLGERPCHDGNIYQVHIPLNMESVVLALGIECLWASDPDTDGKLWSGFRIIDISDSDKGLLVELIEQLH